MIIEYYEFLICNKKTFDERAFKHDLDSLIVFEDGIFAKYLLQFHIYYLHLVIFKTGHFFEKIFFFKGMYEENNMMLKNVFVKALITTFFSIILFWIFISDVIFGFPVFNEIRDSVSVFSAFFVLFLGFYWNSRSVLTQKWQYLTERFNKTSFEIPARNYTTVIDRVIDTHYSQSTMAIDCLHLGMWSHYSFKLSFIEMVNVAIGYQVYKEIRENNREVNEFEFYEKLEQKLSVLITKKYLQMNSFTGPLNDLHAELAEYVVYYRDVSST